MITLCQVRDGVAGNHGNHRQPCRSKEEDERMIKRCPFEQGLLRLNKGSDLSVSYTYLNLLHSDSSWRINRAKDLQYYSILCKIKKRGYSEL